MKANDLPDGEVAFLGALAGSVKPKRRLKVSQWADANRMLSSKASSEPGPWRTDRTPFIREPMDCLSVDSPVQTVVMMFPAQLAKTEAGLNWMGYVMDHAPAPMLVVVPTLEVRKRWVRQRLDPLLRESPVLAALFDGMRSRDGGNAEDLKDFPGGMLVIGGANSPASLASMPIRYVLCDEVDRFPWEAGKEGDPLGLIEERQKTFPRRKTLLCSTPTLKDASRIADAYEASDQRRYYVPCPHCSETQHLKFANLKWDRALTRAWYVCEHCGCEIDEHEKPRMLAAGTWVPAHPERKVRGYHANGLYAPLGLGWRWLEIAAKWVAAQGDETKLKIFINTILAEVWENKTKNIKAGALMERAEPYGLREIPPGCLILTAGVDVQPDRLEVQVVGHGRGSRHWTIDYLVLPGDPDRDETWEPLEEYLLRPLVNAYGRSLAIEAAAIDTGGHNTHAVYWYVRGSRARRVMAIKGSSTPSAPVLSARPSNQDVNRRGKVIQDGVKLWKVGSDTCKDRLYNLLAGDADQPLEKRRVRFSHQLEQGYYEGLTAETYDPERNRWVCKKGRRNEPLDTWNYALAAAHHPELRVHAMKAADWDRLEKLLETPAAPSPDGALQPPPPPTNPHARKSMRRVRSYEG